MQRSKISAARRRNGGSDAVERCPRAAGRNYIRAEGGINTPAACDCSCTTGRRLNEATLKYCLQCQSVSRSHSYQMPFDWFPNLEITWECLNGTRQTTKRDVCACVWELEREQFLPENSFFQTLTPLRSSLDVVEARGEITQFIFFTSTAFGSRPGVSVLK